MLKSFVRTVGLTCLVALLGLTTRAQGAATIALKAVAKNGVAINPPASSVNIVANDTITAEVFISGWNNPPFDGGSALVQTYQAALAGAVGVLSNTSNATNNALHVLPAGWDAPIVKNTCPCNLPEDDPNFPVCNAQYGCVGGTFNATLMASLSNVRTDYIFRGFDDFRAVGNDSLNIRWGATINGTDGQTASRCAGGTNAGGTCSVNADCPGGSCDPNFQSYAGTLNLKAGASVCGTTIFTFENNIALTFIANPAGIPETRLPAIQGLTLTVVGVTCPPEPGACCNETTGTCQDNILQSNCTGRWAPGTCANMNPVCQPVTGGCCVSGVCTNGVTQANCLAQSGRWAGPNVTCAQMNPPCEIVNPPIAWNPGNCAIDARQPYPANTPATRQGFTSWIWTFQGALTTGEDAANDFTIRQVPPTTPPIPPTISSVTPGAGNTLTLNFSGPIQPLKWTCVKHTRSGVEKCLGFLPADADNNRGSVPADILKIIDNLNGIVNPPLQPYQCDMNRSGVCNAGDIITEIDLLNGVTGFQVFNGKTIEVCPTP